MKRFDREPWERYALLISGAERYNVACEVREVTKLCLTDSYIVARQYESTAIEVVDNFIDNMMSNEL